MYGPGKKIIDEIPRGQRVIDDVTVEITELVWNGGAGSGFDVSTIDGELLTVDWSFDEMPSDDGIRELIERLA
jgi:hypothetical protein